MRHVLYLCVFVCVCVCLYDLRDIAAEAVDEIIRGRGERPFPPRLSLKGEILKSQCPSIFPIHIYSHKEILLFDVFFVCV